MKSVLIFIIIEYAHEDTNNFYLKIKRFCNVDKFIKYRDYSENVNILLSTSVLDLNILRPYEWQKKYYTISNMDIIIAKEYVEDFIWYICAKLQINGNSNTTNFKILTGCRYSHYRTETFSQHHAENCDKRCKNILIGENK